MHDSMYFISNTRGSIIFPLFLCFFQLKKNRQKMTRIFLSILFFCRLTQVLEDFQKVLSVNIDQEDEKTLEKISQDVSTLRLLWQKIRKDPTQALSGRLIYKIGTF